MRRNGLAISKYLLAGAISVNVVTCMPGQAGNTTPTDAEIEAKVRTTLAGEPAFGGSPIAPNVSQGVVTLTGNVRSEGERTLATSEVANLPGVTKVQNNLYVVGGNLQAPGANGSKGMTLPAGTAIPIRLTSEIDSKTAKVGDTFHGTTASNVLLNGSTAIPTGTPVTGAVTNAKSGGRFSGSAALSIQLVSLRLPTRNGTQEVAVATQVLSDEAPGKGGNTAARSGVGGALGGLLGAVTGGGTGAVVGAVGGGAAGAASSGITRGKQIDLKPEQLFQFTTTAPLDVTVAAQTRNAPVAGDPTLQARPASSSQ